MDRRGRKSIIMFGEVFRCLEPIRCDFCTAPQSPRRYTCEFCGSHYSDSKFDINHPPSMFGWDVN